MVSFFVPPMIIYGKNQSGGADMGYFLALAAVFFWSFNLIVASYFATTLMPFEIAFGRWLVASLILVPAAWAGIKQNYRLLLDNWPLIATLAVTGIVLDNTLIYYAGRTASAVNMGVLDVTGPIFLVILTRIFRKIEIRPQQIAGLAIAVLGVLVIILRGDFTRLGQMKLVSGDFWMLLNTFCFAVYSLLQSKRPAAVSQPVFLAATAVLGVIILFPLMWWEVGEKRLLTMNGEDLAVLVYLGIFNSVISYLAWNTALAKIGNVKTSIIYYLLPIFSGAEAYFILNEHIYASQVWGGLLVVGGIAMVSLTRGKEQTQA